MDASEKVTQIVEMGFEQQQAKEALQKCYGNVQSAINYLLTGETPSTQPPSYSSHQNTSPTNAEGWPSLLGDDDTSNDHKRRWSNDSIECIPDLENGTIETNPAAPSASPPPPPYDEVNFWTEHQLSQLTNIQLETAQLDAQTVSIKDHISFLSDDDIKDILGKIGKPNLRVSDIRADNSKQRKLFIKLADGDRDLVRRVLGQNFSVTEESRNDVIQRLIGVEKNSKSAAILRPLPITYSAVAGTFKSRADDVAGAVISGAASSIDISDQGDADLAGGARSTTTADTIDTSTTAANSDDEMRAAEEGMDRLSVDTDLDKAKATSLKSVTEQADKERQYAEELERLNEMKAQDLLAIPKDGNYKFPTSTMMEVENEIYGVHTWQLVSCDKYGPLATCIRAATQVANLSTLSLDDDCARFLHGSLHAAVDRLFNSNALRAGNFHIQNQIYHIGTLLISLAISMIPHDQSVVLEILETLLSSSSIFHVWNRDKESLATYTTEFSDYTDGLSSNMRWLADFLNQFMNQGGIRALRNRMTNHVSGDQPMSCTVLAAQLQPFVKIGNRLSDKGLQAFDGVCSGGIEFMKNLSLATLTSKDHEGLSKVVKTLKVMSDPDRCREIDEYRMFAVEDVLTTNKTFNGKMNALTQIQQLCMDARAGLSATAAVDVKSRQWLTPVRMLEWIHERKILSKALEEFLHKRDFVKRVEEIVQFLLQHDGLTTEDLDALWGAQNGQHESVVRNIFGLVKKLAFGFSREQQQQLLSCFKKSWSATSSSTKSAAQLLEFITQLAKDGREAHLANDVLEVLWDLAHDEAIPIETMMLALDAHVDIMSGIYVGSDCPNKRNWIERFGTDLGNPIFVVLSLIQIEKILQQFPEFGMSYRGGGTESRSAVISKLREEFYMVPKLCQSCVACIFGKSALKNCGVTTQTIQPKTHITNDDTESLQKQSSTLFASTEEMEGCKKFEVVDNLDPLDSSGAVLLLMNITDTSGSDDHLVYHSKHEILQQHLQLLRFIQKEARGELKFNDHSCFLLWYIIDHIDDTDDQDILFEFFQEIVKENRLKPSTERLLLEERMKAVDPSTLSVAGFGCFNALFINVNIARQQHSSMAAHASSEDFVFQQNAGFDYLWKAALQNQNTDVAEEASNLLLKVYHQLQSTIGHKSPSEHSATKFPLVDDCMKKLNSCIKGMESEIGERNDVVAGYSESGPETLQIQRCLDMIQKFICANPDDALNAYTPHKYSGYGEPITLTVRCQHPYTNDPVLVVLHTQTNALVMSEREKIADKMKWSQSRILLTVGGKVIRGKENGRLCEFGVLTDCVVQASVASVSSYPDIYDEGFYIYPKGRSRCPAVLMAEKNDYMRVLFELADTPNHMINQPARSLLEILPTEPSEVRAYEDSFQKPVLSMLKALLPIDRLSGYKLSYKLQTLSNLLLPAAGIWEEALIYRREFFVHKGGLEILLDCMGSPALQKSRNNSAKLRTYTTAFRLLKFLMIPTLNYHSADNYPPTWSEVELLNSTDLSASSLLFECNLPTTALKANSAHPLAYAPNNIQERTIFDDKVWNSIEPKFVGYLLQVFLDAVSGKLNSTGAKKFVDLDPLALAFAKEILELLESTTLVKPELVNRICNSENGSKVIVGTIVKCTDIATRICTARFGQFLMQHLAIYCKKHPSIDFDSGPKIWITKFLRMLLRERLPFWTGGPMRHGTTKSAKFCLEYFKLLAMSITMIGLAFSALLVQLESDVLNIDKMIEAEIEWITDNCFPGEDSVLQSDPDESCWQNDYEFQDLLTGHMILLKALFSVGSLGAKSGLVSSGFVGSVIQHLLFRASYVLHQYEYRQHLDREQQTVYLDQVQTKPVCSTRRSRAAAIELLRELSTPHMAAICERLIPVHQRRVKTTLSWDYEPQLSVRSDADYVGLKNAGATCYMNSVLQQMFKSSLVRGSILSLDDEDEAQFQARARENRDLIESTSAPKDSTFYQLQRMFANLMLSDEQFFVPKGFWDTYKLNGSQVNVRQQQDAIEFFQNLIDQMDEHFKAAGKPKLLQEVYGGAFADQKLCRCEAKHKYEKEEPFLFLSVDIRNNKNLSEALDQYVAGDILRGENAYLCAKCNEKVEALKRTCIKRLPQTLVIQLKRFDYDWNRGESVKYNGFLEFPSEIDMEPYTADGLMRLDLEREAELIANNGQPRRAQSTAANRSIAEPKLRRPYKLTGVVVHSGVANAGHYYSYGRECDTSRTTMAGAWTKFDDRNVDACELDMDEVAHEFFGGEFQSTTAISNYSTDRTRSWNAYLLFYEKINSAAVSTALPLPLSPQQSPQSKSNKETQPIENVCTPSPRKAMMKKVDSLVSLGQTVFADDIPATIQLEIFKSNLTFLSDCDLYAPEYLSFVSDLVTKTPGKSVEAAVAATRLVFRMLFDIVYPTSANSRHRCDGADLLKAAMESHIESRIALCDLMLKEDIHLIKSTLVDCPDAHVRTNFAKCVLLAVNVDSRVDITSNINRKNEALMRSMLEVLVSLLPAAVQSGLGNSAELYFVLSEFVRLSPLHCDLAARTGLFSQIVEILAAGPSVAGSVSSHATDIIMTSVPWTRIQILSLGMLYNVLRNMLKQYDITVIYSTSATQERQSAVSENSTRTGGQELPQLIESIREEIVDKPACLAGVLAQGVSLEAAVDIMILCSYNCAPFTTAIMQHLVSDAGDAEHLKPIFDALISLLAINDDLQDSRIQVFYNGLRDVKGFLDLANECKHYNNPKRAYHFIKFITSTMHEVEPVGRYLKTQDSWQMMIIWLEEQLANYSPSAHIARRSNESNETRYFMRTTSAQDTLNRAREIIDNCAPYFREHSI